jgi:hypothetical protein
MEASGVTDTVGAVIRLLRRKPVTVTRNSRPVERVSREAPPPELKVANAARTRARTLLEEQLSAVPDDAASVSELADRLLRDENDRWTVLTPVAMKTETGARLELQKDGSVFAHQDRAFQDDTYSLVSQCKLKGIMGLRLEVLADSRLPYSGPGWGANGNFLLNELTLEAAPAERPDQARVISLRNPSADFSSGRTVSGYWDIQGTVDGNGGTGWAVYPQLNHDHTAVFELAEPVGEGHPVRLTVRLVHQSVNQSRNLGNLGRFRLSVSGDPAVLDREPKRFAATRLTNPWAKLAAAYHVIGKPQAAERLIAEHPAAARGMDDGYAAAHAWEVAIADSRRALAEHPADPSLMIRLATAYRAADRTREEVPLWAALSSANPKDTLLSLAMAALQAWFGQDQELAVTRQRILPFCKGHR